jgi:hypothetical protein
MYDDDNRNLWDFDNIRISEDYLYGEDVTITEQQAGAKVDPAKLPGWKQTTANSPKSPAAGGHKKKKGLISKFFSDLSRLGMSVEDKVIANMRALPADQKLLPKERQIIEGPQYGRLTSKFKVKSNADKSYAEKDFAQKREALRQISLAPELEDILDTMCNECIVYDPEQTFFAEPFIDSRETGELPTKTVEAITKELEDLYMKLYNMLDCRTNAWDTFKRWLIEGILCWEIVYDSLEKPTKIIGMVPVDPATITRKFSNGKYYWVQFDGVQGAERRLLDAQVVYISYQETNSSPRLSYLERLIRPFNVLRIIEQAQIIWTVTNASFRTRFTIPVKGMSRTQGMQTLSTAMQRYKEDIKFKADTGELTINGSANIPFSKEYWFPESDAGTPSMETLGGDGPELSDNEQISYFRKNLYRISKIPYSRFDQEAGETWFGTDATAAARTEIDFGRFVTRLRNRFAEMLLKPLRIWLEMRLRDGKGFKLDDALCRSLPQKISLKWESYNLFEEMMELELMQKRVDFITSVKESMVDVDVNGNDIKFFSSKFLVQKYLKFSEAELKLNDKLKKEEAEEYALAGDADAMEDAGV